MNSSMLEALEKLFWNGPTKVWDMLGDYTSLIELGLAKEKQLGNVYIMLTPLGYECAYSKFARSP
ncbi:hypothetical protein bastian_57 [Salmonella phage bastian]|uniref:Uncharacterized protein n=3 Tax=Epseptimavirus TaxID=2732017 RepID=A0A7G8AP62_9CAUD|nr:hypothetical protein HWD26_gp057 [Salmonella phage bastian]QIO00817.1 hypothetical protein bastian_57 [Salmonella phage bastian]QIO00985.1 hypothetical protein smaug_58 [Salmonella phage smaug]QNI21914.1 hypothetical protein [Salmonella phage 8sent65]